MVSRAAVAAAVLLFAGASSALANVGGQTYVVDASGTLSGDFKARLEFVDLPGGGDAGIVGIDIEGAGDATGAYTTDGGTVVTNVNVTGISPDDGYLTSFNLITFDIKQKSKLAGILFRGVPGFAVGYGFATNGDLFLLTGEELLD